MDLKITENTVEIYIGGERVTTHTKYPDFVQNQYSTHPEDMPEKFQRQEWDDVRIINWGNSIGKNTSEVVRRIFAGVALKEQGYNPSLSILHLGKRYDNARLEVACELALTKVKSPRYHHIKAILVSNQDLVYAERKANTPMPKQETGQSTNAGYIRGADYYGGGRND